MSSWDTALLLARYKKGLPQRELELGIYETSKFMTDSLQAETSRKDCTEG